MLYFMKVNLPVLPTRFAAILNLSLCQYDKFFRMNLQAVCSTSFSEEPISFKWVIHDAQTTVIHSSLQLRSSHFPGTKTVSDCQLLVQWVKDTPEKIQPAKLVITLYFSHSMKVLISDMRFMLSDCSCQKIVGVPNSIKDISVTNRNSIVVSCQSGHVVIPGNEPIQNFLSKEAMTIEVAANIVNLSPNQSFLSSLKIPESTLSKKTSKMFHESRFTDLIMRTGGISFRVHKVVLASQSDVLKRVISLDLTDESFEIPGITAEVMKELLTYFYTGTVPNKHLSKDLLMVADKYRIPRLRAIAERELSLSLTCHNVTSMLVLSSKLQQSDEVSLKNACVKYFKANLFSVIKTEDYIRNAVPPEMMSLLWI